MNSNLYFHGTTESVFRSELESYDTICPSQVTGLTAQYNGVQEINLSWEPAADNNGTDRYLIFNNDNYYGVSEDTSFTVTSVNPGASYTFSIYAIDIFGNSSSVSSPVTISIPNQISKIYNGDFEDGTSNWIVREYMQGDIIFSIDSTNPINGSGTAKIDVLYGTGTNWAVQLGQYFTSYAGKDYNLQFKIKSDAPTTVEVFLQQIHDPYDSVLYSSIDVTTEVQTITLNNSEISQDDDMILTFMFGQCEIGRTIWVDDVILLESE
jgi:hypothetical protein